MENTKTSEKHDNAGKPLILGGVVFPGECPLKANSDGDVVLHAITRAVSGITGIDFLGARADGLCRDGIMDSSVYLREAMKDLPGKVVHVSVSVECRRPRISPRLDEMRVSIARIMEIPVSAVGLTASSGEGLTDFGRGLGINVLAVVTVE